MLAVQVPAGVHAEARCSRLAYGGDVEESVRKPDHVWARHVVAGVGLGQLQRYARLSESLGLPLPPALARVRVEVLQPHRLPEPTRAKHPLVVQRVVLAVPGGVRVVVERLQEWSCAGHESSGRVVTDVRGRPL